MFLKNIFIALNIFQLLLCFQIFCNLSWMTYNTIDASKGMVALVFWIAIKMFLGEVETRVVSRQPRLKTLQFKDRSKLFKIFYVFGESERFSFQVYE